MIELIVDGAPLRRPRARASPPSLLNAGRDALRDSPAGAPRGLYCGIGVCQECRVVVDGVRRALLRDPGQRGDARDHRSHLTELRYASTASAISRPSGIGRIGARALKRSGSGSAGGDEPLARAALARALPAAGDDLQRRQRGRAAGDGGVDRARGHVLAAAQRSCPACGEREQAGARVEEVGEDAGEARELRARPAQREAGRGRAGRRAVAGGRCRRSPARGVRGGRPARELALGQREVGAADARSPRRRRTRPATEVRMSSSWATASPAQLAAERAGQVDGREEAVGGADGVDLEGALGAGRRPVRARPRRSSRCARARRPRRARSRGPTRSGGPSCGSAA